MTTSKRTHELYVYLQLPDSGEWAVVGRYRNLGDVGEFVYAPSYIDAGHKWAIDPINLPLIAGQTHYARRYQGLFDVLRDAAPDAWGQLLLKKKLGMPENSTPLDYLVNAGNGDRWGALAVGTSKKASVSHIASPRLSRLDELVEELGALAESRPPVHANLRKQLFATPSMGGARPKATIKDGDDYWLVKPGLHTDTIDLALLEHVSQLWGRKAGMHFAETVHHPLAGGRSVVRVKRFDRQSGRRLMTVSGASLLQIQYPFVSNDDTEGASYPRLAEELKRIGAPAEDRLELFRRMVFNAAVGNDEDHPRNHAVVYCHDEKRWRLSPAFDVVPNPDESPEHLVMQVCAGRRDISRQALTADYARFGFRTIELAEAELRAQYLRIQDAFAEVSSLLGEELREKLAQRLAEAAYWWRID